MCLTRIEESGNLSHIIKVCDKYFLPQMINSIERDQNCSTSPSPLILRAFYATSIFVRDYNVVYVVLVPIKLNSTAILSGIKVYRLRLN